MHFDDATLMLAVTVAGTVNAAVLTWGALLGASRQAALFWAAGSLLIALAAASILLPPDVLPPWRAPMYNVPFMAGHACWLVGTLRFFGRRSPNLLIGALLGVGIVVTVWFAVIDPNRALRIALVASFCMLVRMATCIVLLRMGKAADNRYVAFTAALVMFLDACVLALHASTGWHGGGSSPIAYGDPYVLTWISTLLSTVVATPMLMLLALSRLLAALERSAHRDSLTGVANRRGFFAQVTPLLARAALVREAGCVLMLDVDHFKRINDRFGHGVGDAVLRAMGATLDGVLDDGQIAVRWGGEEFCVLLPRATDAEAGEVAERIRAGFAARCRGIPILAATVATVRGATVSIGIARGHWSETGFDALQQRADAALYAAKRDGRDRVAFAAAAENPASALLSGIGEPESV